MTDEDFTKGNRITKLSEIEDEDLSGDDITAIIDVEVEKTKTVTVEKLSDFIIDNLGPYGDDKTILYNTQDNYGSEPSLIWDYNTKRLGIKNQNPEYSVDVNGDIAISGDLLTTKVTAREYHTQLVGAASLYESGSTKFGNDVLDQHTMTGSLEIDGKIDSNGTITGVKFIGELKEKVIFTDDANTSDNAPISYDNTSEVIISYDTLGAQKLDGDLTAISVLTDTSPGGWAQKTGVNTWILGPKPEGLIGLQGATGASGPQGATGASGPTPICPSPQGATGPTGPTGPQGDPGPNTTIQGPQGPQGPSTTVQGPQGSTGESSPQQFSVAYMSSPLLLANGNKTSPQPLQTDTIRFNGTFYKNSSAGTSVPQYNTSSFLWTGSNIVGPIMINVNFLFEFRDYIGIPMIIDSASTSFGLRIYLLKNNTETIINGNYSFITINKTNGLFPDRSGGSFKTSFYTTVESSADQFELVYEVSNFISGEDEAGNAAGNIFLYLKGASIAAPEVENYSLDNISYASAILTSY